MNNIALELKNKKILISLLKYSFLVREYASVIYSYEKGEEK